MVKNKPLKEIVLAKDAKTAKEKERIQKTGVRSQNTVKRRSVRHAGTTLTTGFSIE